MEKIHPRGTIEPGKLGGKPGGSEFCRGMPRWRERQRSLPIAEKIELIGKFILETRQLERVKKSCKPFAMS